MSTNQWLIIGISGVTCGGKTTLSSELNKLIPGSRVVSQDDYFWDVDSENHIWIPELNHINFDIVSSLDMERMYTDILKIIGQESCPIPTTTNKISVKSKLDLIRCPSLSNVQKLTLKKIQDVGIKILIIEGFSIFNYKPIASLCNLKYYFTLTREQCYNRRIKRVYEPPDCPGYFEKCVWPEYLNLYNEVKEKVGNVTYFDGTLKPPIEKVLTSIYHLI